MDNCKKLCDLGIKGLELETLYEISKLIGGALDLDKALNSVLFILNKRLNMERATILLLDESGCRLKIRASYGLSPEQEQRGIYKISEGVCGRVFRTASPFVVKDINSEPLFLNKTGARNGIEKRKISFIGVPIVLNNQAVGVLTVDRLFAPHISFEEDIGFLSVVATLIGQFLMLHDQIRLKHERLVEENLNLRAELGSRYNFSNIVGNSKAIMEVFRLVKKVAPSAVTVLILGESGTGKELVARAIHHASPRSTGPFIKVNCAALPENLLESELFGHERGAFTGAINRRLGRFELAHGGTLFLDEIGEMPLALQAKLLRVLQEREFERLGGTETIAVDVRIIAATNRDLHDEVKKGAFREDLYYRLNVVPILIPPLRDRRPDIPPLIDHFLKKSNKRHGRRVSFSRNALDVLYRYDWPGNVRELENLIEQVVIMCDSDIVDPKDLPVFVRTDQKGGPVNERPCQGQPQQSPDAGPSPPRRPVGIQLLENGATLKDLEKRAIISALAKNGWVQARAARELGLTQRQIGYKIKKYNIRFPWEV